ncbi:MAG: acetyl-CoA carboxylase biotin carboxylase subunit [Elusimicrobiota bacterium]
MFSKVLIANRGEIAVRIIRACRELGIPTVAVYSEADRECRHLSLADEAVCIGPGPAKESYLRADRILAAAKATKAEAIHPGYGFLSENPGFSQACADAGLIFIGPPPKAIQALGNKIAAREIAAKNGVPIVPGITLKGRKSVAKEAAALGLPVMIKAAAGGGGKGLRVVRDESALAGEIERASTEAKAAFGDGTVYIEKYIERPRHVEIQILADRNGNVVAAPERDCTVQRRHQKLVEESPSPAVSPELRQRMQDAAIRIAKGSGYSSIGTVEFLLDPKGQFYFMEVNTRLQVEHPITEAVTGVDLVNEQIRLAAGEDLDITQDRISEIRCHALEHRINAEDPDRGFAPCPGRIEVFRTPAGPGVRVDTHIYTFYTIPSYYDSLLAKLVVWAPTRKEAIARSLRALWELRFSGEGLASTAQFHERLLQDPRFISGDIDTHFVDDLLGEGKADA